MKNACRLTVFVLFMSLGVSGILFAQSDLGRISGFIKDPSGATIANAKITVRNNTGLERQTTTNDSGYYIITNVPPARPLHHGRRGRRFPEIRDYKQQA